MSWNLDGAVEVVVEAAGKRGRKPANEVLESIQDSRTFGPYVSAKGALKALTSWQEVAVEYGEVLTFSAILEKGGRYGFIATR